MELNKGNAAPDFELHDQDGNTVKLTDYKGKWVVLYFYPKDNTPGCTIEAIDFSALKEEFTSKNAVVFGVSADSVKSHKGFCQKKNLSISLLSDPEKTTIQDYGVWQLKKLYGKEYYGILRSTFLINPEQKIENSWYKVSVKGHAEEVLKAISRTE